MTPTTRRERFRAHLETDRCLVPASIFDAFSARIAEDLGYEIGMVGGSTASLAVLGAPDLIVLTLTEFADQARRISRASNLPFMVDADHGYGNALNVMRTVEELETAGVAALTIEDTALPQAYGQGSETRLLSLEEGAGKMRAAVAARRDPSLVIRHHHPRPGRGNGRCRLAAHGHGRPHLAHHEPAGTGIQQSENLPARPPHAARRDPGHARHAEGPARRRRAR
jgi:2-methylisocitrate lyase-like PEP mutase family enzyme